MTTSRAVAVLLWLSVTACGGSDNNSRQQRENQMPTIAELNSSLGVSLPSETRIVGVHAEAGIDDMRSAKVEIPRSQLAAFLDGTRIPRFEPGDADLLGPDKGFWDPHRAKKLRVGDVQLPGARFLVVAFDDSGDDVATVYLMNHGT